MIIISNDNKQPVSSKYSNPKSHKYKGACPMKTIQQALKELDSSTSEIDIQFVGLKKINGVPEREQEVDFSTTNAEAFQTAEIQLNPNGSSGEEVLTLQGSILIKEVILQLIAEFSFVVCVDRFRRDDRSPWTHHVVLEKSSSAPTFEIPERLISALKGDWKGVKIFRNVKIKETGNPYLSLGVRLMYGRCLDEDSPEKELKFQDGKFGVGRPEYVDTSFKGDNLAVAFAQTGK